jgi:hypothetical protein
VYRDFEADKPDNQPYDESKYLFRMAMIVDAFNTPANDVPRCV